MQNLFVFMESSEDTWSPLMGRTKVLWDVSSKAGNMVLNRFFINEDAAHELSGVNFLANSSREIIYDPDFELEREEKGMEYAKQFYMF